MTPSRRYDDVKIYPVIDNEDTRKIFDALDVLFTNFVLVPKTFAELNEVSKDISDACILKYVEMGRLKPVYRTEKQLEWSETIPSIERDPANIFVGFRKL